MRLYITELVHAMLLVYSMLLKITGKVLSDCDSWYCSTVLSFTRLYCSHCYCSVSLLLSLYYPSNLDNMDIDWYK